MTVGKDGRLDGLVQKIEMENCHHSTLLVGIGVVFMKCPR